MNNDVKTRSKSDRTLELLRKHADVLRPYQEKLQRVLVGARKLRRMTQKDVADVLDVSVETYSNIEKAVDDGLLRLFVAANALNISPEELFGDEVATVERPKPWHVPAEDFNALDYGYPLAFSHLPQYRMVELLAGVVGGDNNYQPGDFLLLDITRREPLDVPRLMAVFDRNTKTSRLGMVQRQGTLGDISLLPVTPNGVPTALRPDEYVIQGTVEGRWQRDAQKGAE